PSCSTSATSIDLLNERKDCTADSWDYFVHIYTPMIYSWCRKARLQESDAADVTQDVLRAVVSGFEGLQFGQIDNSFRGWLWTITRHELGRHFKKFHQSPDARGGSTANDSLKQIPDWINDTVCPSDEQAEGEVVRRAAELVKNDFDNRTWQAFWLSTVDDMPTPQIVAKLGMTPGAIRQAKFRVLRRLREYVGFD
ncbi:MAG: sigma-70 family RNA polymerase sigma factor, partial [Rubripirellula sp.]